MRDLRVEDREQQEAYLLVDLLSEALALLKGKLSIAYIAILYESCLWDTCLVMERSDRATRVFLFYIYGYGVMCLCLFYFYTIELVASLNFVL